MQKETVIENRYTIKQTDRSLRMRVLDTDLKRLQKTKEVLEENFLNHWIDANQDDEINDEAILNTQLADNESTVSEFKTSVLTSDLSEFKDKMIPVMRACLEFAYYQEKSKEWKAPLNPLNLIYRTDDEGRGHISAFYREPKIREKINSNFLDDVVKLITYLFIPEEKDSIKEYPQMTGQSYLDSIVSSNEFYETYGDEGDDLIDFIYSCLSPRGSDVFSSVGDIMDNVGAFEEKAQVEDHQNKGVVPEYIVDGDESVNLNDYQEEHPQQEQQDEKEKLIDKKKQKQIEQQKELERLQKEQEEKKKQKRKKKENKKEHKKSKLPLFLVASLLIAGGAFGISKMNSHQSKEPQQEKQTSSSSKDTNDPANNKYFKEATDAAANSDYKKASDYFDEYFSNGGSQSELNNEQISRVFNSYLRAREYQKILDNIGSNDTATALVNYLSEQNQLDKVNDLYGSETIIDLVKAINQKDYQKVVDLSSEVSTKKLNQKLQDSICDAFAETNKLQEGKEWAQKQKNSQDLINAIKAHAYQLNKQSHEDIDKALA